MKDSHKDCIREIQDLMLAINETDERYELKDEVLIDMAEGFLDMDKKCILPDEEGVKVSMNRLSSISQI